MSADDASSPPSENVAVNGADGGVPRQPGVVPTCYRHPKREAHIRCVRCDRPICPDCMIPASVGFQCPECVRGGNKTQRVARTALGGRISPNQSAVTFTLIGINMVMFLIQQSSPTFVYRFALVATPFSVGTSHGVETFSGIANGEYYRLLTSMFLHENVTHILFNMWALYVVGAQLEALLGRVRFVAMYFLSGLAGSALAYWLASLGSVTLGASGAIFGLFGALFVLGRRLSFDIRPIGFLIAVNLLLTFTISNISWQGHVGGLVAGAALAGAWVYPPRKYRLAAQLSSSVALAVLIAVIVVLRTHSLTH
jgi:membrane associated rhomboid family serine protease